MSKTCTIIPVFNEANRLPRAEFLSYAKKNPQHLFLFVNDGSTDASQMMIDELQNEFHEGIQTLHLQQNGGKAEAIRQGMLLMKGNTQIRWFFDIEIFIRLKNKLGAERFRQNCRENALESWQEVGDSRLKFKDFVGSPLELLKIYRRYQ